MEINCSFCYLSVNVNPEFALTCSSNRYAVASGNSGHDYYKFVLYLGWLTEYIGCIKTSSWWSNFSIAVILRYARFAMYDSSQFKETEIYFSAVVKEDPGWALSYYHYTRSLRGQETLPIILWEIWQDKLSHFGNCFFVGLISGYKNLALTARWSISTPHCCPSQAADGLMTTTWTKMERTPWILADLGSLHAINKYVLSKYTLTPIQDWDFVVVMIILVMIIIFITIVTILLIIIMMVIAVKY